MKSKLQSLFIFSTAIFVTHELCFAPTIVEKPFEAPDVQMVSISTQTEPTLLDNLKEKKVTLERELEALKGSFLDSIEQQEIQYSKVSRDNEISRLMREIESLSNEMESLKFNSLRSADQDSELMFDEEFIIAKKIQAIETKLIHAIHKKNALEQKPLTPRRLLKSRADLKKRAKAMALQIKLVSAEIEALEALLKMKKKYAYWQPYLESTVEILDSSINAGKSTLGFVKAIPRGVSFAVKDPKGAYEYAEGPLAEGIISTANFIGRTGYKIGENAFFASRYLLRGMVDLAKRVWPGSVKDVATQVSDDDFIKPDKKLDQQVSNLQDFLQKDASDKNKNKLLNLLNDVQLAMDSGEDTIEKLEEVREKAVLFEKEVAPIIDSLGLKERFVLNKIRNNDPKLGGAASATSKAVLPSFPTYVKQKVLEGANLALDNAEPIRSGTSTITTFLDTKERQQRKKTPEKITAYTFLNPEGPSSIGEDIQGAVNKATDMANHRKRRVLTKMLNLSTDPSETADNLFWKEAALRDAAIQENQENKDLLLKKAENLKLNLGMLERKKLDFKKAKDNLDKSTNRLRVAATSAMRKAKGKDKARAEDEPFTPLFSSDVPSSDSSPLSYKSSASASSSNAGLSFSTDTSPSQPTQPGFTKEDLNQTAKNFKQRALAAVTKIKPRSSQQEEAASSSSTEGSPPNKVVDRWPQFPKTFQLKRP